MAELYENFKEPLSKAGFNGLLGHLLDQWHHLLEYTKLYLQPLKTPHLQVQTSIFDSSQSNEWSMVLICVELLFAIPISNAKVEKAILAHESSQDRYKGNTQREQSY